MNTFKASITDHVNGWGWVRAPHSWNNDLYSHCKSGTCNRTYKTSHFRTSYQCCKSGTSDITKQSTTLMTGGSRKRGTRLRRCQRCKKHWETNETELVPTMSHHKLMPDKWDNHSDVVDTQQLLIPQPLSSSVAKMYPTSGEVLTLWTPQSTKLLVPKEWLSIATYHIAKKLQSSR